MRISGSQRKTNIINNIEYIIRSRGETKASFSSRTGVTRATLYRILEGKVNNVHHSTITRIADFFGVTCDIIENSDLEHIEFIDKTISLQGNKNPAAIPVIPQQHFLACFQHRIGQLITQYPATWFFGEASNMVALQVEDNINNLFFPGNVLIIKRHSPPSENQLALFHSNDEGIFFRKRNKSTPYTQKSNETLLGAIIEERI